MAQLLIPDDWDEETDGYCFGILCIPNSLHWRAYVRGAIYSLTRGKTWDASTGTVTEAQAVARAILEDFCMTTCEDLIVAIGGADTAELTKAVKELTSYLAGLNRSIEAALPDTVDYTGQGLDARMLTIEAILEEHVTNHDQVEEILGEIGRALAGQLIPPAP